MKNPFLKKISLCFTIFLISLNLTGQNKIKYGSNYVVIESEDTSSNLNLWKLRTPQDPDYLRYYNPPRYSLNEPAPINETYLEFTGNNLNGGTPTSPLVYKFTAPSTGNYKIGIRMHQPLKTLSNGEREKGDKRNDLWLKIQGNYTTSSNFKQSTLESFHKFWGRGESKWGTIHTLEGKNKRNRDVNAIPSYNLIQGEEYTMTLAGRAQGCSIDYIVLFEPVGLADVDIVNGRDLALKLPEEYRPNEIEAFYIVNRKTGKKLGSQNNINGTQILQLDSSLEDDTVKWTKRDTGDGDNSYYLQNVATTMYFRPTEDLDASPIIQRPDSYTGNFTKWKQVATSNNYFYIENKATEMYFRPETDNDNSIVILRPKTYSGNYTQWKFENINSTHTPSVASATNVLIYPNPIVGNYFNLELDTDISNNYSINIYNYNGQLKFTDSYKNKSIQIPTENLAKGLYIVEIKSATETIIKKIFIN